MLPNAGTLTRAEPHAAAAGPLVRAIGRWTMVALMVNGIIGAGIFGLPAPVHALVGAYGVWAYLACAVIVLAFTLCFAEVSSRFASTGGPYLYVGTAFGAWAGFLMGWILWITRVAAAAAIANVMASYAGVLWPPASAGPGRALALSGVLVALTALNIAGVRRAAGAGALLTILKLVPLVLFVAVGIWFMAPQAFAAPPPRPAAFAQAVLQLVFAFGGFEAAVIAAGELQAPRRDLPFALLVALGVVTMLYLGIQAVCIGTLPTLASSTRPLADAAARFAGPAGAGVVTVGALVSTIGTLCASLLIGPRVLYAMAERRQLPQVFGRTLAGRGTPHVAILVTAVPALLLAVTGTFTYAATLSVIARLLTYAGTAGALVVLRRRDPSPASFVIPGGVVVAGFAVLACVALLARTSARELRDVGIALAAGVVLHAVYGAIHRRAGVRSVAR